MSKKEALMLLFVLIALTLWAVRAKASHTDNQTPQYARYLQARILVPNNPYPGRITPYPNRNRPPFKDYNPNLIIRIPNAP